jgi:nitrogen regulatory protein PII
VEHTLLLLQLEVHTSDRHVAEASNTFAAVAYVVVVGDDVVAAVVDEISEEVDTAQELDRVVYVTS